MPHSSPFVRPVRVRARFLFILVSAALVLLSIAPQAGAAPVVGGLENPRSGPDPFLSGSDIAFIRPILEYIMPGVEFRGTNELTSDFLSELDVAILISNNTSGNIETGLAADEQKAVFDYALGGGAVFVVGEGGWDDDAVEQSFFSLFQLHDTGRISGNVPLKIAPGAGNHPILDGPFGTVENPAGRNVGWFDDLGPWAEPLVTLQNGFPVLAVIPRGTLGPGSGPVVLTADSQVVSLDLVMATNLALFLVPEPATIVQLLAGTVGIAIWGRSRLRRSR